MLNLLPLHGQFSKILGSHYPPNGISWEKSNFIPLSTPTNPFTPILNTQKPCFSRGIYTLHLGYVSYWRDGIPRISIYSLVFSASMAYWKIPPAVRWLSHCPICKRRVPCGLCPPFVDHVPNGIPWFFHIFFYVYPRGPILVSISAAFCGRSRLPKAQCCGHQSGVEDSRPESIAGIYQWTGLKSHDS
jgi:hypothetical protein